MLTKRQLEDAARCTIIDCEDCSVYCVNTIEVTRRAARTALAYREMLEQLEWSNRIPLMRYLPVYEHRCPLCGWPEFNGHAPNCKLAALLKGNKAEETRGIVKLIETKPGYWECENCGESFECEPQKDKYNYCPCCGIKLDEYVSYVTDTKE
jgi:hypothetical protein